MERLLLEGIKSGPHHCCWMVRELDGSSADIPALEGGGRADDKCRNDLAFFPVPGNALLSFLCIEFYVCYGV